MYRLHANGVFLSVLERDQVTSGSAKVFKCQFTFEGEYWDELVRTAVFRSYNPRNQAAVEVIREVALDRDGLCEIPWEVTKIKNRLLAAGVYGTKADGTVLPTIWVDLDEILPGAVGGEVSKPPTPDKYSAFVAEVKADAGKAEQAAKDAEAALQDVKDTGAQAVTDIGAAKDSALDAIAKSGEEVAGSITADVQAAKDAAAAAAQSAKDAAAELPKVQQAAQAALDDIATERENSLTALEDEGGKQQSAVAGAGASALEAIQQAGQTVTEQITQTGATQVGAVQSAGTTQVGLVNAAGQQQAENVAQAGAQQVQAVQTAGTSAVGDVNDARDDAVEEIETANAHAPQINPTTGYWQTWDADIGQYVDTTTKAQGQQGDKGDTGDPGPQGETGATPQLTIGTVTTLEPDEDATVTITGTAEAPVLNFGIPKGEPGEGSTGGSDLPATTAADRGKAPTVNAAGTGYELTGPYAPLSAAIIETAKGNPAVCEDSVEWPLQGMRVYGKSTQDSIPSPENPVPIVSAGDSGNITLTLSDGGDQSQTLSWDTPNGLPGIPVNSGGNFVDADGQEWICNYRDWARGVDVQMVSILDPPVFFIDRSENNQLIVYSDVIPNFSFENSYLMCDILARYPNRPSGVTTNYLSTTQHKIWARIDMTDDIQTLDELNAFFENNGYKIYYQLESPIETSIPADELAAYRALHAYDGTTVVTPDDALAEVEVKYLVDGAKYVQKITQENGTQNELLDTLLGT